MLNIDRALNDDRLMKAMTGLSKPEFNKLTESFGDESQNEAQNRYETGVEQGNRERKRGGGRIGNLGSYATKLFFTLFYFKCYPTFDILGGKEYIDECVWATIETDKQMLVVRYKDEELMVREIKKFKYEINEVVHDREDSIFGTGL